MIDDCGLAEAIWPVLPEGLSLAFLAFAMGVAFGAALLAGTLPIVTRRPPSWQSRPKTNSGVK